MRAILFITTLFATASLYAQAGKPARAKIQKATVYLQGAHLYYSEQVNLAAGNNELVFENISPAIQAASLQASSNAGVVMEVKHMFRYKEQRSATRQYDKEIAQVLDSLEELNYDVKDIDNKVKVLATEKNMLLNNRIIKGEPLRDSLALLRDGMLFLKEKLNGIYDQELKLEKSRNKLEKRRTKLTARYNTLLLLQSGEETNGEENSQPVQQVVVTVFAETAMTAKISFNYFLAPASWMPQYDLQAASTTSLLQLRYFADVTQNSGLDWENVPLTLSTSNPNESNTKPELTPWFLSFLQYRQDVRITRNSNMLLEKESLQDEGKKATPDQKFKMQDYIDITENLIRTEYEIRLKYNIRSDGKAHKVLINQREVPMLLQFAAVPKISTDAFLMARITGWEDMNILPGNARLYFDGGYVGEMFLDASTTSDTLDMNLGRDKTIGLTRKKIKEKYSEKFIGDEKIETRTIELVVKNTKNQPVTLVLEDQIPVAQGTQEIKVVLLKSDGAELEEHSGRLSWKMKLGAKDSRKVTFTYEIRYPKSKPVAGL